MSNPKVEALSEALGVLEDLMVPEHLQSVALKFLLSGENAPAHKHAGKTNSERRSATVSGETGDLRSFISATQPKGAVAEIPALLFWARANESKETFNEKDVVELYRRAALRPPKDIAQSFRDLYSKKYMRLEAVDGEKGHVRLSRVGEDFVIHDLLAKEN
jgi:hypothetical protein